MSSECVSFVRRLTSSCSCTHVQVAHRSTALWSSAVACTAVITAATNRSKSIDAVTTAPHITTLLDAALFARKPLLRAQLALLV
jgi:hypothetical protein